jgi:hypothetical protein
MVAAIVVSLTSLAPASNRPLQRTKAGRLLASHPPGARHLALRIARSQPHEHLSVLEPLDSPAIHRRPPRQ